MPCSIWQRNIAYNWLRKFPYSAPLAGFHGGACHNQDNPKEKHLWEYEPGVSLFEVIRVGFPKNMASLVLCCYCQIKLPQQVALTELTNHVNAQVRVILMTRRRFWQSFHQPALCSRMAWNQGLMSTATLPQQIALTASITQVCACVRAMLAWSRCTHPVALL